MAAFHYFPIGAEAAFAVKVVPTAAVTNARRAKTSCQFSDRRGRQSHTIQFIFLSHYSNQRVRGHLYVNSFGKSHDLALAFARSCGSLHSFLSMILIEGRRQKCERACRTARAMRRSFDDPLGRIRDRTLALAIRHGGEWALLRRFAALYRGRGSVVTAGESYIVSAHVEWRQTCVHRLQPRAIVRLSAPAGGTLTSHCGRGRDRGCGQ